MIEVQKAEAQEVPQDRLPGRTRIVILGGGFAGVAAAMRFDALLARRSDLEVTLISRENYSVFTPMLHEVACGDLDASHITNPLRKLLRRVIVVEADVETIDLASRTMTIVSGFSGRRQVQCDHLVLALGSETDFFGLPGVEEHATAMKTLGDAVLFRNRVIAMLEMASVESNPAVQKAMLTFVVAGGGFAGVETVGALNDLVRESLPFYPQLDPAWIRVLLVHGNAILLPELGEKLGVYAEVKLRQRQVEVRLNTRVTGYREGSVLCKSEADPNEAIAAETLIWTTGVTPCSAIRNLDAAKQKGRVVVNASFEVPGYPGVWAIGDCAALNDPATDKPYPPTAQHALREGNLAAANILARLAGKPLRDFRYKSQGQLASIGRRAGVARVMGVNFVGFFAWALWSAVYLFKLPRWEKKIRVAFEWLLNLFFSRDLVQLVTTRDVETLARLIEVARSEHAPDKMRQL